MKSLGDYGEDLASRYLIDKGFEILAKNFRCKIGEIDIIAFKEGRVHFVEVKLRRNSNYGRPRESVNYRKMNKLTKVALIFMQRGYQDSDFQFDVIEITLVDKNDICYIPNAFIPNSFF